MIIGERTFLHRVLSTLKSLPRSFGLNHLHIIIIITIIVVIVVVIFIILINLLTAQEGESPLWIYTLCHQPVISSSRLTFVISHIFILFTAEIFFAQRLQFRDPKIGPGGHRSHNDAPVQQQNHHVTR